MTPRGGLGSVPTMPLTFTISAAAYRDVFGLAGTWESTPSL